LLFSHNLVSACSCMAMDEKQSIEALKKMAAVFQGEVVSISPRQMRPLKTRKGKVYYEEQYVNVEFKVFRAWKGIESDKVIVESETNDSSCSLGYKVGQIVYVVANGKPLATTMCNRGHIAPERFTEIFGAEKVFEEPVIQQSTQQNEPAQNFWSKAWNNIVSFFS